VRWNNRYTLLVGQDLTKPSVISKIPEELEVDINIIASRIR